jgi:anti-anti-sigma regulatory factor
MAIPPAPAAFHLTYPEDGSVLLEVEGRLDDADVVRWTALLKGVIAEGRDQIAVDLRGCWVMGPDCVTALLAAAATARTARSEVAVVSFPDSEMERTLRSHDEDLPGYASVRQAWEAGGL